PGLPQRTVDLARECAFDFEVLAPDLPAWDCPDGLSEAAYLRQLTFDGALERYGPPGIPETAQAYAQIEKELAVIEGLGFPGYFLIVHDIPDHVTDLAEQMYRLPRHLRIHAGGMVICDRPVGQVCPIEWARKEARSVLQWDKDDCAAAGLVKFDLLGLGILSALCDCFE